MAAIVTDSFRRNNANFFLSDIEKSTSNYYVGIGKSDRWALNEEATDFEIPIPRGIPADDTDVKANLSSLIRIESANSSRVVPRIAWISGSRYKAYSPTDSDCFYPSSIDNTQVNACYAVLGNKIYLCLHAPNTASIDPPVHTDYAANVKTDGYVWIVVESITAQNDIIDTDQFISISREIVESTLHSAIKDSGGGLLYGFSLINGGSGYLTGTSLTFNFVRTDATVGALLCPAVVTNGAISSISLPSGYAYNEKNIVSGYFTGGAGSGAAIVPHIAPLDGFAYNPSATLPAWYIGVSVDAFDNIGGDGLFTPYRQISILSGIEKISGSSVDTLGALRYVVLSGSEILTAAVGDIIQFNGTSGPKAYFDGIVIEGTERRLYFHQNSTVGFGRIVSSGELTSLSSSQSVNYNSLFDNEYVPQSGQVIFTENRSRINRQSAQTEEIKIIIQF